MNGPIRAAMFGTEITKTPEPYRFRGLYVFLSVFFCFHPAAAFSVKIPFSRFHAEALLQEMR